MVEYQLRARDITDPEVLAAFNRVPRHRFVPPALEHLAYSDEPLPIGYGQTISQPYVVALMSQLAQPKRHGRALDVGVGSGYQTAVLAELCDEVYGIEIVAPLAEAASRRLAELGYKNVEIRAGDGYRGWPEHAPFDAIIVAAAADRVPQPLVDQLAPGGRLVLPLGHGWQELVVVEKQDDGGIRRLNYGPVAFVPMTGEAESK
jgi:protein-L-isoaspartate(D-aspartate) O-methyltransferase